MKNTIYLLTMTLLVFAAFPAHAQQVEGSPSPQSMAQPAQAAQKGSAVLGDDIGVSPTVKANLEAQPQQTIDPAQLQPDNNEPGVFERLLSGIKINQGATSQLPVVQFQDKKPVGVGIMNFDL
uniref:Uncharacterized protein n=1 Tax=Cyanothece sp. (strain PCC 7425 / ATCC 29141) TaxID=395961 RepID=B8HWV2_CYAP4